MVRFRLRVLTNYGPGPEYCRIPTASTTTNWNLFGQGDIDRQRWSPQRSCLLVKQRQGPYRHCSVHNEQGIRLLQCCDCVLVVNALDSDEQRHGSRHRSPVSNPLYDERQDNADSKAHPEQADRRTGRTFPRGRRGLCPPMSVSTAAMAAQERGTCSSRPPVVALLGQVRTGSPIQVVHARKAFMPWQGVRGCRGPQRRDICIGRDRRAPNSSWTLSAVCAPPAMGAIASAGAATAVGDTSSDYMARVITESSRANPSQLTPPPYD